MDNKEEILDSGEIYKDPAADHLDLPQIDLDTNDMADVDWTPLLGNWAHKFSGGYTHHKERSEEEGFISFEPRYTRKGKTFNLVVGLLYATYFLYQMSYIGLFICAMGLLLFLMQKLFVPTVFLSKKKGMYWKRGTIPIYQFFSDRYYITIEPEDIKAIQLLKKRQQEPYSCELNLVRKNNARYCLVIHKNKSKLAIDGDELAKFLGVPFLVGFEKE